MADLPRGFPPDSAALTDSELASQRRGVHAAFATPIAVLEREAVDGNVRRMAEWCAARGVELQPHWKTSMSPWLTRRQLEAGAAGVTVASVAQARTVHGLEVGIGEIQIAGEVVQDREAEWLGLLLADPSAPRVTSWIDSADGLAVLESAAGRTGAVFDVLLEVGYPSGRAGVRTDESALALGERAARCSGVRLVGVAGYEGGLGGDRSPETLERVRGYLESVRRVAESLSGAGLIDGPPVLSAGGSMFFDVVVEVLGAGREPARVILRSGCYATHDHLLYERNSPFGDTDEPFVGALTVWASVVSLPEPGLAILDAGRRDVSFDQGLPVALAAHSRADDREYALDGATVTKLNDQHAFLRVDEGSPLRIGDRVRLGISHPCTTFDKWRAIPVVDDRGVVEDIARIVA